MEHPGLLDAIRFRKKYIQTGAFANSLRRILRVIIHFYPLIYDTSLILTFFIDVFRRKVLNISNGIQFPGGLRWELFACLICAWMLVYFAIWKSIKSSAKVRYLTATLPFLLIIVFLGRSLTLEGADKGLRFFFKPNWILLTDAKVCTLFITSTEFQTYSLMFFAFNFRYG